jgi:phenylalanyl-tRNA synthetase beta chain
MTISYNWLCEYLPADLPGGTDPDKLSRILTSIGLEVENLEKYEDIPGGLKGLVTGEVLTCEKHPDADKLKVTTVSVGDDILQIVCGASNVAAGQKVIVAPVNTDIHPTAGGTISIKKAKIRGVESQGMICAEDEIGMGRGHEGILVLPADTPVGKPLADIFVPYSDHIFEIGLTPNRIDAMSHIGVARDVCAYLSHHHKKEYNVVLPYKNNLKADEHSGAIKVKIENTTGCRRYSGISLSGITVKPSPVWLQQRLKSIGVKSINNIVDLTNFILHETGQPLHAFDADKIKGNTIIVKNLPENTSFVTLDGKERKLAATDLMICNESEPMCIAGVYGGMESGVTNETKNIFLESAWFDPSTIRKTSLAHGLRTDAAARFEKGTDISNTATVLKRAALLVKELAGGAVASEVVDVYPDPVGKTTVGLKYHYLKKLSGKNYHGDTIKNILKNLGFDIVKDGSDEIWVNVPFSKPDVRLPADIVEEIMRIDGLDNIEIPEIIAIAPAVEKNAGKYALKEKIANHLTASGCYEIFTNSISNSQLYDEKTLGNAVKMINSLSSELDILRPSMLQSGLQAIAYNVNRKNSDLRFYEFGKTYARDTEGGFTEKDHLCIYVSGHGNRPDWKEKGIRTDFYHLKGMTERLLEITGLENVKYETVENGDFKYTMAISLNNRPLGMLGEVAAETLKKQDIRQAVFFADLDWENILAAVSGKKETYREISKFPAAQRDLAIVIDKHIPFAAIEKATASAKIAELAAVELFDVFESDKLGAGKKSMAINYIFTDDTRTLTDKDIDGMMQKLIGSYENKLNAEIRK